MLILHVPESVYGRGHVIFFLPGGRCTSARAGSTVVAATNKVTTRTKVLATAVCARAKKARWTERHGLVGVASGPQAAEIVTANLARGKVVRRSLLTVSVAGVTATHWQATTASTIAGLALTLSLSGLSSTGGLFRS